ncbi:hypothetical protein MDOR_10290 [Mycolicibacterium doricum]|uniref:PE domain-containing protein n=1 Tax=Mycolicibacterium doricum TaxID=126673 RepID=A0A7I7VPA9_9MYCO|nr:hypothetical protein MDOR_10290 [Mycolicibacterium doricum]
MRRRAATAPSSSAGRIEASQPGVPGGAAVALSGAVAKWQIDTEVLFGRLSAHGAAMASTAGEFTTTDSSNAAAIKAVGEAGTSAVATDANVL